ncbi:cell wall synthase accessory phosphoprotein MacP [Pilibacter termitis]|jgi:hypothetical protein|nr:cell wall synthase accessory phosphoprotein MacP [Pilibacter termitis]
MSRSERRRQLEELEEQRAKLSKQADKELTKKENEISNFYRKEMKKQDRKTIKKSRVVEKEKMDKRGHRLNLAIGIISLLIVILIVLIIFF